jgi:integrase
VGAWLDEWLRDIKAHDGTRGSMLRRYREVTDNHLVPGPGRCPARPAERAAGAEVHDRLERERRPKDSIGTLMEPQNVNRVFEQLRSDAGLPWLHLHDLRHAFATLLLDQGVELRTVMELLGHSTIRLTADTDGHLLRTKVKGASDLMDGLLGEAQ